MSSKALLSVIPQAMSSKFPVVLHMDCTFKCNHNEFHPFWVTSLIGKFIAVNRHCKHKQCS